MTFHENVLKNLRKSVELLGYGEDIFQYLATPNRELHVAMTIKMDDGSIKTFEGYRCQHNNALGPYKGGIRMHPQSTIDTVRALATEMTWKTSLMGLPLGGGKGIIIADPTKLSLTEKEKLIREYVGRIYPSIGPEVDIPAPDVNTNGQMMAWAADEYSKRVGRRCSGSFTGKPVNLGGSLGREDSTARGGMFTLREAMKRVGVTGNITAIQGYGNVGSFAASLGQLLLGLNIVAVSDVYGAIYNPNGLDLAAVNKSMQDTGTVINTPNVQQITNEDLLALNVNVLVPAALEGVLTEKNACDVRAQVIVELANGPTTEGADWILHEQGVHVIPDFLANGGGVTVSYFEMLQNKHSMPWTVSKVQKMLDKTMSDAYIDTYNMSKVKGVDMRKAGMMLAVKRVVKAAQAHGWI